MTKIFCDACGKEIKNHLYNNFEYRCHIDDMVNGKFGSYTDSESNPISGRPVIKELCNKCYNIVLVPAVKALNEINNV